MSCGCNNEIKLLKKNGITIFSSNVTYDGSNLGCIIAVNGNTNLNDVLLAINNAICSLNSSLDNDDSSQEGITAAGTVQGDATSVNDVEYLKVDSVPTNNNGIILNASLKGKEGVIINNTSNNNTLKVYPASGEHWNGLANNAPIIIYPNQVVRYFCWADGVLTII